MKRFFSTILLVLICTTAIFAQDQGDEYDDGYVYEQNGAGDQFVKINIGLQIPLNFGGQLHNGGSLHLGYYRFLNGWFAMGGELTASYNVSIGNKVLVMVPVTFGVLFQPSYDKFEFPIYINMGLGYETWQNMNYYPSFIAKISAGGYYRLNEMCSVGLSLDYFFIPETYSDSSKNFCAHFMGITIGARYHF